MEQDRVHRLKEAVLIFKGTSDDLLFWVLIDTLFLTVVKRFTLTEISLTFTVSFWVALLFKRFGYESIKRMKVGKSLICSAVLFLAAAVLITFGPTLPLVIAGQCLYEIAPDFYDVSDILLKELCIRDTKGRDYVQSGTLSTTMYSIITLITALLIDPLMNISPYLPMIICIVARVFSLALAVGIYARTKNIDGLEQGRKSVLRGRFIGRSTVNYLVMAALFGGFTTLSISYLKLLLQDNLAVVFDEASVIAVFSYCIIATRVFKILGNATIGGAKRHKVGYTTLGIWLIVAGIVAACCGLAGVYLTNMPAVVVTTIGLLIVFFTFDPMLVVMSFLTIENLNDDQAITVIYRRGLLGKLIGAIASTFITTFLAANSYRGVMALLIAMSVGALVFGIIGTRYYNLQGRDYIKSWPAESFENTNSLMVAAALLMLHYGAVQSHKFNPTVLEARVGKVEHIASYYRRFGYVERRPYTFDEVYQSFTNGYPSAVYGSYDGEYKWYPVLYADDEDGVTASYGSGPLFLNDFEDIQEQCVFTLKPKRLERLVRKLERSSS